MNLYLVSQKMGNLSIGLELMIVGMLTVFVILLIVIWGGKLLIAVVNKVAPEEVVPAKKLCVKPKRFALLGPKPCKGTGIQLNRITDSLLTVS